MSDPQAGLRSLYPFLHARPKDAASENDALLESVRQKALHGVGVKQAFFDANVRALVDAARTLAGCYREGGKLLTMGNGGEMASSGLLTHCLVVATDSIHRMRVVHVACYHILWDLTHTLLADYRGKLAEEHD